MGDYEDRVLPRFVDVALGGRAFGELRARVASRLDGEVLEVGFGSGRTVPHYPPRVSRVRAVDPATHGRTLAAKRVAASPIPVEHVGLDGGALPLEDASVDHVLSTWTLCTIPGVERALGEMRRVRRPGGALHFIEHGRAPDPKVARWQDRLTPVQRRMFGGCHPNRRIDELVAAAGFAVGRLDQIACHAAPLIVGFGRGLQEPACLPVKYRKCSDGPRRSSRRHSTGFPAD